MSTLLDKIYQKKKKTPILLLSWILYLISLVYRFIIMIRNFLYDYHIFKIYKAKACVVSIGNIVAGGVGKTPFTLMLAQKLLEKKINLAILSRGYKSKFEHQKHSTIISKGKGPVFPPEDCGDEPYLISKNVPGALFIVGKDRIQSAKIAEAFQVPVLLLDDGMQHRRLHRDNEIVILNAQDPFGKNFLLPRGLLREPPKALNRANLIVLNHVKTIEAVDPIVQKIRCWTQAPIIMTDVQYQGLYNSKDQKIGDLKGQKVAAFCGIGNPSLFYKLLEDQGAKIILKKNLSNHQKINLEVLTTFSQAAKKQGASLVVCSEKDYVKIQNEIDEAFPVAYAKIDLKIIKGEKSFQKFMDTLCSKKS